MKSTEQKITPKFLTAISREFNLGLHKIHKIEMKDILLKLSSIRERVKLLQIEQKPRRPKSILSDKKNS